MGTQSVRFFAVALSALCSIEGSAVARTPPQKLIPSPGGEVAVTSEAQLTAYTSWHYAPARRAGDYVYISGVVIGRKPSEPNTPASFKAQARLAFRRIELLLKAFDVGFRDVVMINSFHDWSAPEFGGDRMAQFDALREVKDEFISKPYPAWTAVGTSGTIRAEGIVEIQIIAYAPQRHAPAVDDRAAHLDHSDGASP